mgnify:CR=1
MELLLAHHPDRRAEAMAHLDFAIEEFQTMQMAPSLERGLGRKGMVGGEAGACSAVAGRGE